MSRAQEILKQILDSAPMQPYASGYMKGIAKSERIQVGQFYAVDGDPYILAQVASSQCALISLVGGNRWKEGIVVADVNNITPAEFSSITGSTTPEKLNIQGRL